MSMRSWRQVLAGRDIVVISPQYWGDLWVSKHWIANELAQQNRVLFVEPHIWVGGILRRPWRSYRQIRNLIRPLRQVRRNLYVWSPKFLPRWFGPAKEQIARDARALSESLGLRKSVILNFDTNYLLAREFNPLVKAYYCVDPVFPRPSEEDDERITCAESDVIFAVSEAYKKQLEKYDTRKPIYVIPHGFAFERARRIDEDAATSMPRELDKLRGPIVGFIGSIHDSVVDIDRLEFIARSRPDCNIVLIGPYKNNPLGPSLSPYNIKRLKALRNVFLLGPRHFLDLPKYVKHFDVALVLTNIKDFDSSFKTSRRTLFKWLLYLSMGKPVVAPWMHEAAALSNLVYLARDDQEYLEMLQQALTEGEENCEKRIEYASHFSFDKTLDRITEALIATDTRLIAPV